jgi:hypothetical protein
MRSTRGVAWVAFGCALAGTGCAPGPDLSAASGSRQNPLVCAGRPDEFAYLGRLRCADGTAPHWQRTGNTPVGPYGGHLDRYRVRCVRLNWETQVYFDRRHRPLGEKEPPEGLRLAPASSAATWCGETDGCSAP